MKHFTKYLNKFVANPVVRVGMVMVLLGFAGDAFAQDDPFKTNWMIEILQRVFAFLDTIWIKGLGVLVIIFGIVRDKVGQTEKSDLRSWVIGGVIIIMVSLIAKVLLYLVTGDTIDDDGKYQEKSNQDSSNIELYFEHKHLV